MNPDVVVDRMERPGAGTRKVCGSSLSELAIAYMIAGGQSDFYARAFTRTLSDSSGLRSYIES